LKLGSTSPEGKQRHLAEGKQMRGLMKSFDGYKRKFCTEHRDIKVDLPEPLDDLTIGTKVLGGELTITNTDMKSFF